MTLEETRARFIDLLVTFTKNEDLRGVPDDARLDECGLDSLAIFDFVVGLEKEFATRIKDDQFNVQNFLTVGSCVAFLHAH